MVLHGHKSNTAVAHPLPPAVRQCATDSISRGICSLRSHIPCRLRRALQKGTKKPLEQALRHLRSLLRREGDSNPRNPQGVQQFSRLPRSTTPASLLQAMQMNLFNLHCRGATVYVAVRPNIRKSQKQMNLFNLHCRGAQYMRRSRIYAETESNANEFFQSYQNFHPGFCNVEIMTHICRKKRRRNVPRQPDSTVTFNLWFYDTDR